MHVIMKKQCALPPGYYHSGFVATHALEHMMYGYTLLVEHSLVHWYQQCVTVHHVPKCMSFHKATVVITKMPQSFRDYMYITSILLL